MSSKKKKSEPKEKEITEPHNYDFDEQDNFHSESRPAEKAKGRSMVGVKRTRKSRDQIYKLQKCFEDSNGKPSKQELKKLSKDTGLKLQ